MTGLRKGVLMSVAAAFWAAVFLIPFKAAAQTAPRPLVVLAMLIAAAVFNTATSLVLTGRSLRLDRTAVAAAAVLAVLTIVGNIAVAESLARAEPAITSVVLQTQVLFVALGSWWLLSERITMRLLFGSVLALAGFAAMQSPSAGELGMDAAGAWWAVLAALSFALMLIVTRRVIHHVDPIAVNALRLWLAVGFLLFLPGRATGVVELAWQTWALAAGAALAGPTLSRLLLMYAVGHISASYTKLITLVSPIFAFALGENVFGTWPSAHEAAGAAVILAGVALPVLELTRSERPAP